MAQNADIANGQLPLKNVVLCSTSLPQDGRTRLEELATQMGAVHKLDLTIDVTHLVVGDTNTAKYKYVARERPDIHVLHPSWIEAVRNLWMEGSDVNMSTLEKEHRHPTLAGLKICMTGFIDNARNSIMATVRKHGAEYHGDLTKQITHLIVAEPKGAKYEAAKAWGVPAVSIKWLEDSENRGMALDVAFYDPSLPLEQQGSGAVREQPKSRSLLGKRARESETISETGPRKLRRSASSRLQNHSQGLWQDISTTDSMLQPAESDQWSTVESQAQPIPDREGQTRRLDKTATVDQQPTSETTMHSEGLFSGWHIFIFGFEASRTKRLADFLQPHGACVVDDIAKLEDTGGDPLFKSRCVLVPHDRPSKEPQLDSMPAGTLIATEWWVERCIHQKQVIDPDETLLCQPLWDIKIPDLSRMTICTTGFGGIEFRQTAEAIKLTGATYEEKVVPSISILISGSASLKKEKSFYAAKHRIPVVSAEWLWASIRSKRKAPIEEYKLQLPDVDPLNLTGRSPSNTPAPSEAVRPSHRNDARTDVPAPVRFSNTRKRHATPALQLQASKPITRPTPKPSGPFIHEDYDDDVTPPVINDEPTQEPNALHPSPRRAQPLQNISPNASPRKPEQMIQPDKEAEKTNSPSASHGAPASPPTSHPDTPVAPLEIEVPQPQHRSQSELTANLQSIMEQRRASSRAGSSSSGQNPAQRNKNRRLGRAVSGTSLNARSFSNGSADAVPQSDLLDVDAQADEDALGSLAASRAVPELPSTQLGYETPEAEAARLLMGKRLGTVFSDESAGTRLASLGTVKDSGTPAPGSRAKARQRDARKGV